MSEICGKKFSNRVCYMKLHHQGICSYGITNSEEVKEGPYHEYGDHHDFSCEFCMSGEDAAYYSKLINKAYAQGQASRDAEVEANAKKAEIAVKALELIDNRYEELSYIEMGELQIIAQTALKELSELMKEKL